MLKFGLMKFLIHFISCRLHPAETNITASKEQHYSRLKASVADKRRVMKKDAHTVDQGRATFMMQQLEDSLYQRLPLRRPHSFSLSLPD